MVMLLIMPFMVITVITSLTASAARISSSAAEALTLSMAVMAIMMYHLMKILARRLRLIFRSRTLMAIALVQAARRKATGSRISNTLLAQTMTTP